MRSLKFRVWWKDHSEPTIYTEHDFFDDTWTTAEYIAIEQYTGLKDKNGKEIYEGDIVKYSLNREYIGQIVFDFVGDSGGYYVEKHYGWGIHRDDYNESLGDFADDDMRCGLVEVIGNIHENPELLESKNAKN